MKPIFHKIIFFYFLGLNTANALETFSSNEFQSDPLGQPSKPYYSIPIDSLKDTDKRDLIVKVKLQLTLLGYYQGALNNLLTQEYTDSLYKFCSDYNEDIKKCVLSADVLNLLGVQGIDK